MPKEITYIEYLRGFYKIPKHIPDKQIGKYIRVVTERPERLIQRHQEI